MIFGFASALLALGAFGSSVVQAHDHHRGLRVLHGQQVFCFPSDDMDDYCYNDTDSWFEDGRCATSDVDNSTMLELEEELDNGPNRHLLRNGGIEIDVHWHVIYRSDRGIQVTDEQLDQQLAVLNDAFAGTPFTYVEQSRAYIENIDWFRSKKGSEEEFDMKASLREGGPADLNIYIKGWRALGWSTFPWQYKKNDEVANALDGVVARFTTLPGSERGFPFNEGATIVHETGHWLGLYHTFNSRTFNGNSDASICNNIGDMVRDTPAEATPTFGCPIEKDSCPESPGEDPITNWMDYSDDSCMEEFTPLQVDRMIRMFYSYRATPGAGHGNGGGN